VRDRARGLLTSLGRRHADEQILVITHQGVIKSLIYAIEKRKFRSEEQKLIDKNLLQTVSCCNDKMTGFVYNIEPLPRS
jgi:probable phosphoglycerate mutase